MVQKREWAIPQTFVQQFAANEYVAACGDTEYGKYKFVCDAPEGILYYYDKWGIAHRLGNYHPCSKTHEASVSGEFPNGFVDRNSNQQEDVGEEVIVWIERGFFSYDAHATTNLNRDSWEVTKS